MIKKFVITINGDQKLMIYGSSHLPRLYIDGDMHPEQLHMGLGYQWIQDRKLHSDITQLHMKVSVKLEEEGLRKQDALTCMEMWTSHINGVGGIEG